MSTHFAPWDERTLPRAISAEDAAGRARAFAEIERRVASILETLAESVDGHARQTIARHARHHAWHAQLWEDNLSDATAPGGEAELDASTASLLEQIAAMVTSDSLIESLAAIYRVLIPRKVTAYTYYVRALGSAAADADSRWIEFIMKDEFDSVRDGELLLQSLLRSDDDARTVAEVRNRLEPLMVSSGGLVGPGSIGMATAAESGDMEATP